jgi:hypothetical protein
MIVIKLNIPRGWSPRIVEPAVIIGEKPIKPVAELFKHYRTTSMALSILLKLLCLVESYDTYSRGIG